MRKMIFVGVCVALAAGVLSTSHASAASQPTVGQVQTKINTLSAEFDRDVQQYDQLSVQLPAARAQLKRIDKQVTNAEKLYKAANVLVAQAAAADYEGSGSTLAQVLTSNNPSSALNAAAQLLELTGSRNEETENLLSAAQTLTTAQQEQKRTALGIEQLLAQSSEDQNTINSLIKQEQVTLDVLTAEQQGEVDMSGGGNDARVPDPWPTNTPAEKAVWFAYQQLGCDYVFGDTGPCADGFDCSGLMYAAWQYAGVTLPRDTYEEWAGLPHISLSDLQIGDLLIYNDIGHVAMYVGNGMIIDAPHTGAWVELIPMDTSWYEDNFDGVLQPLSKALLFATVGGHRGDGIGGVDEVVRGHPLRQFARLGVPHPHPVPDVQPVGGRASHGGLDLARALGAGQRQPGRQERPRQPVLRPGARCDVAAGEQRGDARRGTAHD